MKILRQVPCIQHLLNVQNARFELRSSEIRRNSTTSECLACSVNPPAMAYALGTV